MSTNASPASRSATASWRWRRCEPQRQATCLRRRLITRRREAIVALLPPRERRKTGTKKPIHEAFLGSARRRLTAPIRLLCRRPHRSAPAAPPTFRRRRCGQGPGRESPAPGPFLRCSTTWSSAVQFSRCWSAALRTDHEDPRRGTWRPPTRSVTTCTIRCTKRGCESWTTTSKIGSSLHPRAKRG
jgi:hypothetical protein